MSSFANAAGRFALFPDAEVLPGDSTPHEPDASGGAPGSWLLARMLWLVCTAVAAFGCFYAVYFLSIGLVHALVGILTCVAADALILAFARRTGRHREALDAVCVLLFAMLAVATLFQDGLRSPALCWLAAVPLVALLAGSTGLGVVLGAAFVAQVAWLRVHPEPFTSLSLLAADRGLHLALSMSLSALFVGLCIAFGSHWARELRGAIERGRASALAALADKARFVSQVSHEIRTPLQGLIGATAMLDEPGLATDRRERLVDVQRQSAGMLAALVNDILDFSKLEAGKVRLEQGPVDLPAMLAQVGEFFAPQACAKGLALTSSASPDVPHQLLGDATRVRQIVINLVANAIKFTDRGSVHIHLGLAGHRQGELLGAERGMRVRIEIADSGLGIEAGMIDSLFKPFQQADETITRRFGGTGLGLSIADDLARLMGGRIEVSSAPGRGSTFTLVVPLKLPGDAVARPAPPRMPAVDARGEPSSGEAQPPALPAGLVVLVAEDDPANQAVVAAMLEVLQATTLVASNGNDALALLRSHRVDVVLMDLHMPELDGIETTRQLREHQRAAGAPRTAVIAATGSTEPDALRACLAAGMDAVLAKPFALPELRRRLGEAIAARAKAPA